MLLAIYCLAKVLLSTIGIAIAVATVTAPLAMCVLAVMSIHILIFNTAACNVHNSSQISGDCCLKNSKHSASKFIRESRFFQTCMGEHLRFATLIVELGFLSMLPELHNTEKSLHVQHCKCSV